MKIVSYSRPAGWLCVCLLVALCVCASGHAGQDSTRLPGIPFSMVDNQIVLSATVNDSVRVDLFLDTGFGNRGILLFDPELGKRLGLVYVSQVPLGGGGDKATGVADVATGVRVSLPGATFNDLPALVAATGEFFGHLPVDGIIGGTLFERIVEIDYKRGRLSLFEADTMLPPDRGEEFALSFTYGVPVVQAEVLIDGKTLPVSLMVDTGAGLPFFLFTYSDDRILPPPGSVSARDEGVNGIMEYRLGRVSRFSVGHFSFHNTLTAFLDANAMGSATVLGQNGFLGQETLRRFRVILDYPAKRMFLRPNASYSREYEFNMAGLTLNTKPDGTLLVLDVVKDSPGWKQQIRGGDIITTIDGRPAQSYTSDEIQRLFVREGNKVELVLRRGAESLGCKVFLRRII